MKRLILLLLLIPCLLIAQTEGGAGHANPWNIPADSGVIEEADSTASNEGHYATRKAVTDSASALRADLTADYGEMYITGGGATTVDVASTDHPLTDFIEGLSCDHWGFTGNSTGTVTVWSTAAGGDSTDCYSAGSNMGTGEVVYITGTTNGDYDGVFVVDPQSPDMFRISANFTSDQADNAWIKPDLLTTTTGAEGTYMVSWNLSFTCANNFDVFEVSVYVNGTRQVKSVREHKSKTATDVETVSGHCLIDFSADDRIHLAVRNNTGTGNLTVGYGIVIVNDM